MNAAMRWRIIVLQVVALLVLGFGSGAALYASNFTHDQIKAQLEPQQIFFPTNAEQGLPADLSQYAGQQVLTGDQAHAYADKYIALHLSEIGDGKPYSYWSNQARVLTDPTAKAAAAALADTKFKGETLRGLLNEAWTFSVIGSIAQVAGFGLVAAALVVLIALAFEVVTAIRSQNQPQVITKVPSSTLTE